MRRDDLLLLGLLAGPLVAAPAAAAVGEWQTNPQSRVRLVSPWTTAPQTGAIVLGVETRLAPGWHGYWKNPGDAGFAPQINFARTPALRDAELRFPAPRRFALPGGLEAFGYEDEVVYPVAGRLEAAGETHVEVVGSLDYLVCEVECVPYRYELRLAQPLAPTPVADPEGEAILRPWLARLPADAETSGSGARARLEPAEDGALLVVEIPGASGAAAEADLFVEANELLEPGELRRAAVDGGLRFELPLARTRRDGPLPARVSLAWTATGLRGPRLPANLPASLAGGAHLEAASAAAFFRPLIFTLAGLAGLAALAGTLAVRRARRQPLPEGGP